MRSSAKPLDFRLNWMTWPAILTLAVLSTSTFLSGSAIAQPATRVVLGTATPGGGFPVYGEALAKVINASGAGLVIEPRNTKGSYENMPMLEGDQIDIALVAGEPAFEALSGIKGPVSKLKIIAAMYSTPGMFVVPANSYAGQAEPIRSVGSWSFILARPTLDEKVAYQLTRALHLNEKVFAQTIAQARETTAANTVAATFKADLLHPGSRRYLQEIGLLK